MIVHASEPVTLIGGGAVGCDDLAAARALAPRVVAADSGAEAALAQGVTPEAVFGDLDSLAPAARARIPAAQVHEIPEQDTTDFDKALRHIEAPLVIGVGFCGARFDHQLAACNALVRRPGRRCLLLGPRDVTFLAPPSLSLTLEPGCPVSLFPMGAVEGRSEGLHWPIDGLTFTPDGQIGTSNRATGPVDLTLTAPKMLMMLPRAHLRTATAALLATPARW
ncbi:thiamine diphosphokinase [Roseovarius spongiae]|uniref:Thiamine diphosphokinase n=1 Tax=Roseovarius spongiae TaxID=2320272 RepID=A0A3A8AU11_9RHOB|nr:thiamine diphosphokinase [Roseovarius spongiae]RKF15124.1 thiamine diphosphokinase [Roseovarius spongiae]